MEKKLVINVGLVETRIALLEGQRTAELYYENQSSRGMVGNIYKGKVSRVLPGMQSAFVNIGTDRSAFLYGGDVVDEGYLQKIKNLEGSDIDPRSTVNRTPIEKILREGQEILVQVAKEPLGTKGPRVTMLVTIPGRYLVLMPEFDNIGISRRIENEKTRSELEELVEKIRPPGMGVIVRTAAEEVDPSLLEKDLKYLLKLWEKVRSSEQSQPAPALLYQEPDITLKTCRDLEAEDLSEIVVDDRQAYDQLEHFLSNSADDRTSKRLKHYDGEVPIFDAYEIEMDIARALSRKVWLPSGGYLVIDQTEALTSFDVNTGKYVGSHNARETILKTNLESAVAIVHQLRLRNLGGIIVIDFIDMEELADRRQVNEALELALKDDKSRTNVLAINELGLVQMTRKRTRESLERSLTENCPHCSGNGRILKPQSIVLELMRDLERFARRTNNREVIIHTREDVIDRLRNEEKQLFEEVAAKHGLNVGLRAKLPSLARLKQPFYEIIGDLRKVEDEEEE